MNTYNITELAKLVRRSVKTLQRWDREGKLVAKRTMTNRRYYTNEHLQYVLGEDVREALNDDLSA